MENQCCDVAIAFDMLHMMLSRSDLLSYWIPVLFVINMFHINSHFKHIVEFINQAFVKNGAWVGAWVCFAHRSSFKCFCDLSQQANSRGYWHSGLANRKRGYWHRISNSKKVRAFWNVGPVLLQKHLLRQCKQIIISSLHINSMPLYQTADV